MEWLFVTVEVPRYFLLMLAAGFAVSAVIHIISAYYTMRSR